jgi:CheY-like chemotaxis protein
MPTALVIDDNSQMANSLCHLLDFLGYTPDAAYGARTAMSKLNKQAPDLIFMDIHMPGVDGFEVLAYLRRLPRLDDTQVIIVSSDDQEETIQRAKDAGALDFIVKPVYLEKLEEVLKKHDLLK